LGLDEPKDYDLSLVKEGVKVLDRFYQIW
jgi:hypothetical protein